MTINAAASITTMMDQSKVQKIINNLLSNALKFTDQGNEVHLAIKVINDQIEVTVTDNGPGIPAEDLPHIFKRFYQVIEKNGSEKGGTGIGLSLSKELAQLLGGDLELNSIAGQGVICRLNLPLEPLTNQQAPTIIQINKVNPGPQDHLLSDKKMRILLVEDNQDMQDFIIDILNKQYMVDVTNNGVEAWQLLQDEPFPDLIISDIMMPHMDGFELIGRIRKEQKLDLIPLVMLTAKSLEKDKLNALNLGIDDYITKPFSVKELEVRIRNLLKNKLIREEWLREEKQAIVEVTGQPFDEAPVPDKEIENSWMTELHSILENMYADPQFDATRLAQMMQLSKRQLERKLKANSGLTPAKYIQTFRLNKAYQILFDGNYSSIADVCYNVGFGSPSHFSRIFIQRFGKNRASFDFLSQCDESFKF